MKAKVRIAVRVTQLVLVCSTIVCCFLFIIILQVSHVLLSQSFFFPASPRPVCLAPVAHSVPQLTFSQDRAFVPHTHKISTQSSFGSISIFHLPLNKFSFLGAVARRTYTTSQIISIQLCPIQTYSRSLSSSFWVVGLHREEKKIRFFLSLS